MSRARDLANIGPSVDAGGITGRNLIINGAMQVAQRSSGPITVSDSSNEGYSTLDRWFLNFNASPGGALDFSQSTDAPDGFANSIKLACSTADASHTGTEQILLVQYIEAQNLQQLAYGSSNAKSITISWYMKAVNFSGPISLALETVDGTAEYYVVSKTPTSSWARYSVTIPGSSSATINNDTGSGLRVNFVVAGSSSGTYAAAADSTAWSTTRADYRNDIGNLVSSTSNDFYITGVQLEVGSTATPFEHRSFGDELTRCQRYYYQIKSPSAYTRYAMSTYDTSTDYSAVIPFPIEMRSTPSMSTTGTASNYSIYALNSNKTSNSVPSITAGSPFNVCVQGATSSSTVGAAGVLLDNNAAGTFLGFSAEL